MRHTIGCARCQKCGLVRVEVKGLQTTFWSSFLLANPGSKASPFVAAIAWARVCRHAAQGGAKHPDCLVDVGEVCDKTCENEINRIQEDLNHGFDGTNRPKAA